jgi:hypothetical protein
MCVCVSVCDRERCGIALRRNSSVQLFGCTAGVSHRLACKETYHGSLASSSHYRCLSTYSQSLCRARVDCCKSDGLS